VADLHIGVGLAVPVHAAVALLEARRVPRDLPVQHPPAVSLEVDALRRCIGRHEDPDRRAGRLRLELGLGPLPVVGVHPPVESGDPVTGVSAEAVREQKVDQPLLGIAVLGEDDDPLAGPHAV
jgi:hypothetical protein